jgi:hypothetical protein
MVEEKREISRNKFIFVFVVTAFIFIIGILIGTFFTNKIAESAQSQQDDLKKQILSLELKNELLKQQNACNVPWSDIWKEKIALGSEMSRLETRLGKEDTFVVNQKEYYSLVQLRTWLVLKELKERCNSDQILILFFYTNQKDDSKGNYLTSEDQGYILNKVYEWGPERVGIFSFDINIDDPALNTLKEMYNVEKAPTLIINDVPYEGFKDYGQLIEILSHY